MKKRIDYEHTSSLNFTVYAYDFGIPQLNTSALILVKIININDNAPLFSSSNYTVSIPENFPKDSIIIVVNATDADLGDFGTITYHLTGKSSAKFKISQTGGIKLAEGTVLDYEVEDKISFNVVATDGAQADVKRSSFATVYINVIDVNDNLPKFNQTSYNVSVVESINVNPPFPILQVFATDKDNGLNGKIHYKIVDGNEDGNYTYIFV